VSRILIAWELGLNLGHLARLLPIAQRLQARGHAVLAAVRDIPSAASVLGPADITFVAAPHLPQGIPPAHRPTGYADILLSQGWADSNALWGLVRAWLNLFRMFRPDLLVLDYSPTVQLAARIARIPCVLIGNGFELPPDTDPLPAFPGFSWADPEQAKRSEELAIAHANAVLRAFKAPEIKALRDLLIAEAVLFTTFPEWDHYGPRPTAQYIGPLFGHLRCERVDWPDPAQRKVFACLRPDTQHAEALLQALAQSDASVICFAPGFSQQQLACYGRPNLTFTQQPVQLAPLASSADACVSYGAEGTTARFLLAGVPQLFSPKHVEARMAARRIAALGAAVVLREQHSAQDVAGALDHLLTDGQFRAQAMTFAQKYPGFDSEKAAEVATAVIEGLLRRGQAVTGNSASRVAAE
jgi:UDP:flavonoid glycosyltransferase YjiC (YdhE family)